MNGVDDEKVAEELEQAMEQMKAAGKLYAADALMRELIRVQRRIKKEK